LVFRISSGAAGWEDATMTIYAVAARSGRRTRRRWVAGALAAILAAVAAYGCIPRQADLTAFDPDAMARLETAMWRDYYEKRYVVLFGDLYDVSRSQYGFSPLDSVRIALAAATAAKTFQPSTSRAGAEAALSSLVTYFGMLSGGSKARFEPEDAARTELAWWQARREAVTPDQYGLIIARVATLVYGIDGDDMRRAGVLRAKAIAYRDARDAAISEADWSAIDNQLRSAYRLLKKALSSPRS
jgi:hypothetical protein